MHWYVCPLIQWWGFGDKDLEDECNHDLSWCPTPGMWTNRALQVLCISEGMPLVCCYWGFSRCYNCWKRKEGKDSILSVLSFWAQLSCRETRPPLYCCVGAVTVCNWATIPSLRQTAVNFCHFFLRAVPRSSCRAWALRQTCFPLTLCRASLSSASCHVCNRSDASGFWLQLSLFELKRYRQEKMYQRTSSRKSTCEGPSFIIGTV